MASTVGMIYGKRNVRIVFNTSGILSENHYYPFGLPIHNLSTSSAPAGKENRYLYNGKELQDDLGLNWMDYGARFYDAGLGRWHSVDGMAEWYYDYTPYSYVGNNPLSFIDPDGNFRTRFGAWLYKLFNGGDGIEKDSGGEYYVYTNTFTIEDGVDNFTQTVVFDRNGRKKGKDLELERQVDDFLANQSWEKTLADAGIEYSYTNDRTEAIRSMTQLSTSVVLPNVVKGAKSAVNAIKKGVPNSGSLMKSVGAASRAEMLAKKLKMNINSPTTRQVLNSLDETVDSFISMYRKSSIRSEIPGQFLNQTVEEALKSGNTTIRKLLTDGRFVK